MLADIIAAGCSMSSSQDRAGRALSRCITSGIWLLAALLVLHWGTPSPQFFVVEVNGPSSLGSDLAPDERAAPRSAHLGEQASRVSTEARQYSSGDSDPGGSDQAVATVDDDARQPGFARAIRPAARDNKDIPAHRSSSFAARAPPNIA